MSLATIIEQEARLFILQQLAAERDGRGTSQRLKPLLREVLAINRPIEWVETQVAFLREMGAVQVRATAAVTIVEITDVGREHLSRAQPIAGVKPAPSESV
ncbi:MAG: hypothetical protein KDJ44_21045 [Rhodoblastus sp.]|nr:hypothetical protein [Rhodoblastus sp.]